VGKRPRVGRPPFMQASSRRRYLPGCFLNPSPHSLGGKTCGLCTFGGAKGGRTRPTSAHDRHRSSQKTRSKRPFSQKKKLVGALYLCFYLLQLNTHELGNNWDWDTISAHNCVPWGYFPDFLVPIWSQLSIQTSIQSEKKTG